MMKRANDFSFSSKLGLIALVLMYLTGIACSNKNDLSVEFTDFVQLEHVSSLEDDVLTGLEKKPVSFSALWGSKWLGKEPSKGQSLIRDALLLLQAPAHQFHDFLGKRARKTEQNFECVLGDKPTTEDTWRMLLQKQELYNSHHFGRHQSLLRVEVIKNRNHLRKALGLDKTQFADVATLGNDELFKNRVIDDSTIDVLFRARVHDFNVLMSDLRIAPQAYEVYQKRGAKEFFKLCGREAVVGVRFGAEMNILIKAGVRGSEGPLESAVKAKLAKFVMPGFFSTSEEVDELWSSDVFSSFSVSYHGGNTAFLPTSISDFSNSSFKKWAGTLKDHSMITGVITRPYHEIFADIDPEYDAILAHMKGYIFELDRLVDIKNTLDQKSTVDTSQISLKKYRRLSDLIARLKDQLEACHQSAQAEECLDVKLRYNVESFSL